jgi:p-cumate 2,3-dioxygenase subunit beta
MSTLRERVEDFLYHEAALLDDWRLDDWLALFEEDGRYTVPALDKPDSDPRETLGIVDDNMMRLRGRIARLKGRHAYREFPWSRTRRLISNVRLQELNDSGELLIRANFLVYRIRGKDTDPFIGQYEYRLRETDGAFKILSRRAQLDLEILSPQATVSFIL